MPNPSASRIPARAGAPRHAQQGVVLFIALIVLVAMTLAGVALMRSVDTTLVVAGNVAFKQSAISVADRGTQEAVAWLEASAAGGALQTTNTAAGYFSAYPQPEPDWFDINSWSDSVAVNGGAPDAAGNVVRFQIHRMCTNPDQAYNAATNTCGMYFQAGGTSSGGSMQVGARQYASSPRLYYRITTRVDGPRGTVSIIQTSVLYGT